MNPPHPSEKIVAQVRKALKECADKRTAATSDHFFKEGEAAKVYGVQAAKVRKIAQASLLQIKEYPKQTIFEMCEELWKSGYFEEMLVACVWSESLHKQYEPADFLLFERWLGNYVSNWADCDTLCNHTIGDFLMRYPDYIAQLKEWAKSSNRWLRRGAAVSLIIPARRGLFLNDILEIAQLLLTDKDDLVQKGYGWMLKAASMSETFVKGEIQTKKKHLDAVFSFVLKNKSIMPRTALRYAIEKMPADMKAKAMEK
ncbi:MAG: DNA alkylation repair protein [Bacteroidetes bacterium]|nr:DNA alkylation repair protein [Bacteroidota bacterium]